MTKFRIIEQHLQIFTDNKDLARLYMERLSCFEDGYSHNTLYKIGKWDGRRNFYEISNVQGGWLITTSRSFSSRVLDILKEGKKDFKIPSDEFDIEEIKLLKQIPKIEQPNPVEFLKRELPNLPFTPYPHQIKLFMGLVQNYNHLGIASVGSGKSLAIYLLVKYFMSMNKTLVLLVPTIMLVQQIYQDFIDYGATDEIMDNIQQIGGEFKNKDIQKPVVISTWQSAAKSNLSKFDIIAVDECLHPETLISTETGSKQICKLEPGEMVYTLDKFGNKELKPIVKVHKNISSPSSEQMYEIETDVGILRITGNHKVKTQRGWVRADELTIKDDIISEQE